MEPRDHEVALLTGFRAAYEAIARHRDEFLGQDGLLAACATDEMRFVPRQYQPVHESAGRVDASGRAAGCGRPESVARPAVGRGRVAAGVGPVRAGRPVDGRRTAVHRSARQPGRVGVGRQPLPQVLATKGLAEVEAKVASLDDVDEHRQTWLISASLATRPEPITHAATTTRAYVRATVAGPRAIPGRGRRTSPTRSWRRWSASSGGAANWLGLELLDDHHWAVCQMGAGLSNGYTGYGALPRAGRRTDRSGQVPRVGPGRDPSDAPSAGGAGLRTRKPPDLVGPGFHGLGGISYGLNRLVALLGRPRPRQLARRVAGAQRTARAGSHRVPVATPKVRRAGWPQCKQSKAFRPPAGWPSAMPNRTGDNRRERTRVAE